MGDNALHLGALLLGGLLGLGAVSLSAADAPTDLAGLTYSGEQTALEALDRELNAAGNDAAKLAAVEKTLFALLRRTDASLAARQAACTRLGFLLGRAQPKANAEAYQPLATMLLDERESDLARLALEPARGAAVDGMFTSALAKTSGRTRLGIFDSLARRRSAATVGAIAAFVKDTDAATADAALRALGEIGSTEAVAALRAAPDQNSRAVVAAKLAAAARLPAKEAVALAREIERAAAEPAQRNAALRLSLGLEAKNAPARIVEILGADDWTPKQAALEAAQAIPAAALVPAIAPKFSSFDSPTQAAVLTALGRKADALAVPLLTRAATHEKTEVRHAALTGLGFVPGTRDIALLLARAAASANSEDNKPAKLSLSRLTGRDVGPTIVAGAERGEPALRAVFVEQIALRNMTDSLPLLLSLRRDPDAGVRAAAVGALGEFGGAKEQSAVIEWARDGTDPAEQSRALSALVKIVLRQPNKETRGAPLFEALEKATPDAAVRLVPTLARLGGSASAEAAARLATRDDAKVADAAVATLGRWTDRTALLPLVTVAEKAQAESVRSKATDSALRYMERNREPWSAESTDILSRLAAGKPTAEAGKRILALLNRADNEAAIKVAERFQADTALAANASETIETIRANLAGAPTVRGSGAAASLRNVVDGRTSSRWTVPTNGDEWLEVDFNRTRPFHKLTLDQTARQAEFPERYEVYVTDDPKAPGKAVATGTGQRNQTVIALPAGTRGRYVIIKNTLERKDSSWSVCELFVE